MNALVEHFFRHEYGRLVAVLSARAGLQYVDDVEDAAQAALVAALEHWTRDGVPDNPSAWTFRVASNHLVAAIRKGNRRREILEKSHNKGALTGIHDECLTSRESAESQLRMLLVCCDDSIPAESSMVFALRTLCGFETREIAIRLFTSEANVYQRLSRARARLRVLKPSIGALDLSVFDQRESRVLRVLYLLFTEGYLSSDAEVAIRHELCDEAIRLALIAAERPGGPSPTHAALVALMYLHRARTDSRMDELGRLLLLEEQDRSLWSQERIQQGLCWLARSAEGDVFSRYHAEAGIAAEHCLAASYAQTAWGRVIDCYALLEDITGSPLHRLNRAMAVAERDGAAAGLMVLDGFKPPTWLAGSYQWSAVLADLCARLGKTKRAQRHMATACEAAPSEKVRQLLEHRFAMSLASHV